MPMRFILFIVLLSSAVVAGEPMQCDVGPVTKTFGSVPWLVYSCQDGRSVVIVSAPGSPASPFYFMFSAEGDGYRLVGEGNGSKEITDRVLQELKGLRKEDVAMLVRETQASSKH